MKEKKIIGYFPRSHFWKIWEKRKVKVILTETNEKVASKNFRIDGTLKRAYIHWKNGNSTEQFYFPDGKLLKEVNETVGDETRQIQWDENGNMLLDRRVNEKTQIETHYHPNGKLKIRHDRKTGEYEEWSPKGILKKKGRWLNRTGGIAELSDFFAGFEKFISNLMCVIIYCYALSSSALRYSSKFIFSAQSHLTLVIASLIA